jgi:Tol biopolymer transport system component
MKTTAVRYFYYSLPRFALFSLVLAVAVLGVKWNQTNAAMVAKTWSGGGATSNWSEAANWSDNVIPGPADDVVFDSTSTKDATIDVDINIGSIRMASGYTGTISQTAASSITISGCNSRPCFSQSDGAFNASSNTISLIANGFGSFTMTGGSFNGGSGDITLSGAPGSNPSLSIQGGSFRSTSGNLTIGGNLSVQNAGTSFLNNNGTVVLTAPSFSLTNDSTQLSVSFNNLTIDPPGGGSLSFGPRVIVNGNLALNDGLIGSSGSTIEVRGGLSISPNFDGGVAALEFANGTGQRTFTFSSGLVLPKININDPGVTIQTSGTGTLHFPHQFILQQGTVNQGDVDLLIEPLNVGGGTCFAQSGGTFKGSNHPIIFNSNGFGAITLTGGTFNGGSGDLTLTGDANSDHNLSLRGGTFNSTTGTLFLDRGLQHDQEGTFNANGGTVTFQSGQNVNIAGTTTNTTFHDLNFNKAGTDVGIFHSVTVTGNLNLNGGTLTGGTIEARSGVNISPSFDGGNATLAYANGSGPRTFTFDTSLKLPGIVENDPNVTLNTSGTGTLIFPRGLSLLQGQFNQGNVDLNMFPPGSSNTSIFQSGGTFNGSSHSITLNSVGFGAFKMDGGVFNGGSGDITLIGDSNSDHNFRLTGGTFNSTSGNLTLSRGFQMIGGIFNHDSGTVVFNGGGGQIVIDVSQIPTGVLLNNLMVDKDPGTTMFLFGTVTTIGNLTLAGGTFTNNGTLKCHGGFSQSLGFGGGGAVLVFENGGGPRDITFTVGTNMLPIQLNDPNVTIDTSGSGTLNWQELNIQQGTVNQGEVDFDFSQLINRSSPFGQSGGTFNGSDKKITLELNSTFTIIGGAFNGGSGDILLNDQLTINGGTFTSTSGTLFIRRNFLHQVVTGTFLHHGGTVTFDGTESNDQISIAGATETFNNINFNRTNVTMFVFGTVTALGDATFNDGSFSTNGTINARGNVTVGTDFDGGGLGMTFTGSAASGLVNQTFTNNGTLNPSGAWTVNKPSGIVTVTGTVSLAQNQTMNITSGTLFLNGGGSLSVDGLTIGAAGKLINDSSTTITLGGNVSNSGTIDLQGAGAGCPENDTILLRSSVNGTRRNWAGGGVFRLVDVDVKDQGGTAAITVFNGTNGGNNAANFTFTASCPTELSISPQSTSVVTGGSRSFTASGGFGTRTFSIATNHSGASVNSVTGAYVAGATPDVSDTVRVTDSLGATAEANVDVTGSANKLAFTIQPANATAGQVISPTIQVTVEDSNGVAVTDATNSITLAIATGPIGGGVLSGTLTRTAASGIATFDNISINKSGTFTLQATSSGLSRAASDTFNINAGPPAKLAFSVQPTDSSPDTPISLIQVIVQDNFGNLVTNATNSVTLSLGSNPGNSVLSGTATQSATSGVVNFSDISLNNPANGYSFTASAPSLVAAFSSTFNVTSPFVVSNTNLFGPGSLQQAIINANNSPVTQTISFKIPGTGPFVIAPTGEMQNIGDHVIIDGTTQPGFAGTPIVILDGSRFVFSGPPVGLHIRGSHSTIRGLSIVSFTDIHGNGSAIFIDGSTTNADGNLIEGNDIGFTRTNFIARSRNDVGIRVKSSNNSIGGISSDKRNSIGGNDTGIAIVSGQNNNVTGNVIGFDQTAVQSLPNVTTGILIQTNNNVIEQNIVFGNTGLGILISSAPSHNLSTVHADNNLVSNNTIARNVLGGIVVDSSNALSVNNRITGNQISGSGGLGIQLGQGSLGTGNLAPLPNDPGDPDSGSNHGQNYPVITALDYQPNNLLIGGRLNSNPSSTFNLEFFSSSHCNLLGNGEGEVFLGSSIVTTGPTGNGTFNVNLPVAVDSSQFITATATDASGNTSEFSQCKGPQLTIQGIVKNTLAQPISGVTIKVHNNATNVDKFSVSDSLGNFLFSNLSQGQTYSVTASKINFGGVSTAITTDPNGNEMVSIVMSQLTFTVSGHVSLNSSSLSGVTVSVSNGTTGASRTTDSSGNYSLSNIAPGSWVVTPTLPNFNFTPSNVVFNPLNSDQTANFAATNLLATLTGRIVFASNGEIREMNADGSGITTVVPKSGTITFSNPSYSSSGAKIAYIKQLSAGAADTLLVSNKDGSGTVTLASLGTTPPSHVLSWSPDGTKIATSKLINGVSELVTVNTTTGVVTPIVTTGVSNTAPDWSPDSTQLVFTRDDATTNQTTPAVFKVNANGTGLTKLTNPILSDSQPKWSPDGTKIAFLRSNSGVPVDVVLMNADGNNQHVIFANTISNGLSDLEWAPDGSRLAVTRNTAIGPSLVSILPDGTSQVVISPNLGGSSFDWGPSNLFPIISPINTGRLTINFGGPLLSESTSGIQPTVEVEPISPASVGVPPNGFVFGELAYQVSTSESFVPPVTVCVDLPTEQYPTAASFNAVSLLHDENGMLVDVTTSRDIGLHRVCGQVTTLGNFVVASQVNNVLPSIHGLVIDADGDPLDDFQVSLSGDATQQFTTGADGSFSFVNLTDGGSYLVTPSRVGYFYIDPYRGYENLSGEQTIVFVATVANFSINGNAHDGNFVPLSNVTMTLNGAVDSTTTTDNDGNYSFSGLLANGFYSVSAALPGYSFNPQQISTDSLANDLGQADFLGLAPTAADVSISGRVTDQNGNGLARTTVVVSGGNGGRLSATTNSFGYYEVTGVQAGQTYVLSARHKGYTFGSRVEMVTEDLVNTDFAALSGPHGRGTQ